MYKSFCAHFALLPVFLNHQTTPLKILCYNTAIVIIDLVLVLVLGLEGLVLVLVLGCLVLVLVGLVLVLVLGLECLVLVLEGQVLVNITGGRLNWLPDSFRPHVKNFVD